MSRAEYIAAVRAQAWDDGKDCPTCDGSGKVYPGRRIVHAIGSFSGADWDEDAVIATIEAAREVKWLDGYRDGHNLAVQDADGKVWRFQVARPAEEDR